MILSASRNNTMPCTFQILNAIISHYGSEEIQISLIVRTNLSLFIFYLHSWCSSEQMCSSTWCTFSEIWDLLICLDAPLFIILETSIIIPITKVSKLHIFPRQYQYYYIDFVIFLNKYFLWSHWHMYESNFSSFYHYISQIRFKYLSVWKVKLQKKRDLWPSLIDSGFPHTVFLETLEY